MDRIPLDQNVDFSDKKQKSEWITSLNKQLDELLGGANSLQGKSVVAANLPGALVYDSGVLGAAVTTQTITGLSSTTHGGYVFEFFIYNGTAGTVAHRMTYNAYSTTTDYYYNYAAVARGNDCYLGHSAPCQTLTWMLYRGEIAVSSAFMTRITGQLLSGTSADVQATFSHYKSTVMSGELTQLVITASAANGIGIGSRFRLWRRI